MKAPATVVTCALVCGPAFSAEGFREYFAAANRPLWSIAHYQFSHPAFDTDWSRRNVVFDNELAINLTPQTGRENGFLSGSIRRQEKTGFGRYSASLKAAKGDGLVTGFFTYTGPYYGTQHDEIDIEILGKNTRSANLAWFVDGILHQHTVALPFDAAQDFHDFAFVWTKNSIEWFADGVSIHKVTSDQAPIPQTPSFAFANLWATDPRLKLWAGLADPDQKAQAQFEFIAFDPIAAPSS